MADTKSIIYVGGSDAVDIAVNGAAVTCVNGEPVELPTEIAESLLEQDIWQPAPAAPKPGRTPTPPPAPTTPEEVPQ